MFDKNDQWPLPNYSTGPTKHLHALGVISLNYNMYERGLVALLEFYVEKETAEFLFDGVSNERRVATIRHFSERNEKDPTIRDMIEHALLHFARCAENRNILMHSKQYYAVSEKDLLSLEKKPKGKSPLTLHLQLADVRRVADEMMDGVFFITDLWRVVDHRGNRQKRETTFPPPSLPGKPQIPDILNLR